MIDRAEIKADAKEKIKGKIGSLLIIGIIYVIIMAVLGFFTGGIGFIVLGGAFTLAMNMIFIGIAKNNTTPDVKDLFATMNSKDISRGFFATVRQWFFIWAWSLLLIVPGIVKAFAYSQMYFLMAENPDMSAADAQKKSIEMMRGHKGELFVLYLSFIGWMLLAELTFGILLIWLAPYISTTFANFHLKLLEKEAK